MWEVSTKVSPEASTEIPLELSTEVSNVEKVTSQVSRNSGGQILV
jgi:hypothetical protein